MRDDRVGVAVAHAVFVLEEGDLLAVLGGPLHQLRWFPSPSKLGEE